MSHPPGHDRPDEAARATPSAARDAEPVAGADTPAAAAAESATGQRAGFCTILGLPNVGKSTLLNRVLGVRLAAVSPRPQTTRNRILGVANVAADAAAGRGAAQIVYLDTPGVQRGGSPLRRYMRDQALAAAGECDVALVVVDATDRAGADPERLSAEARADLDDALSRVRGPALLALNKIDRLADKRALLPMLDRYQRSGRYAEIIPISALTGDGVDALQIAIARRLPPGPALFPEEMITDRAERFLAGELIREQLFRQLGKEVPYATAVAIESFEERPERGDVVIKAAIHVERPSQKGIVVGKGGARIKQIGQAARAAISELLACPVHVVLFVVVTPGWSRSDGGIRNMGYE